MTSSSAATERISRVVKEHIPNGKMVLDVGSDVTFCLPEFDEGGTRQRENFPSLFDELDSKMDELGLDSYGVADTTLEEVRLLCTVFFYFYDQWIILFSIIIKIFLRVADDPSADPDVPDLAEKGKTNLQQRH